MVELKYNHEWLAAKIKPPSKKTWTKRKLKLNSVGLSFPSDSAQAGCEADGFNDKV